MALVVGAGTLVGAHVAGVVLDVLAARDALALAALVEAFLVAARVLARVRQTVHAAHAHRRLHRRTTTHAASIHTARVHGPQTRVSQMRFVFTGAVLCPRTVNPYLLPAQRSAANPPHAAAAVE